MTGGLQSDPGTTDARSAPAGGKFLLVGMMGAGKSTVGQRLAERLGVAYVDSDEEVVRRRGQTIAELWREQGEAAFRAEEARVLAEVTAPGGPAVVSVGGGAAVDPANRARLGEAGTVVWLRADPATLAGRVGDGAGRPLLDGGAVAALARLDQARRDAYGAVADVVVDVDGLDPDEIVDRILAGAPAPAAPG